MKFKLPSRDQIFKTSTNVAEKLVVIVIVGYVIVSVGNSVRKNYQINQRILKLENQIKAVQQEKDYLDSLIAYYKTDTFKELKAREELGLQKPGEKVVVVPIEAEEVPTGIQQYSTGDEPLVEKPLPHYVKWLHYFFGA